MEWKPLVNAIQRNTWMATYHVSLFQHLIIFLTWTLQLYRMISELKAICNDMGKSLEDIIERVEELRWCDSPANPKHSPPKTLVAENALPLPFEEQEALSGEINFVPGRLLPDALHVKVRLANTMLWDPCEWDLSSDVDVVTERQARRQFQWQLLILRKKCPSKSTG